MGCTDRVQIGPGLDRITIRLDRSREHRAATHSSLSSRDERGGHLYRPARSLAKSESTDHREYRAGTFPQENPIPHHPAMPDYRMRQDH
jgi:hypothetical protein